VTTIRAAACGRVGATLGEGPVWDARDGALWFVDIKGRRLHRFAPGTGALDGWDAPAEIGWALPAAGGGLLAGLADGLHRFSPQDGFDRVLEVEAHLPGNRLNDAAVDPAGRVWFGSMDNAETDATGRLYVLVDGEARAAAPAPVVITNGPAISPDGRTLYAVDTLGRAVDAWTIEADARLVDRRRFLQVDPALGHPDGASCDAAGGVWLGLWGGWAARRYDADGALTHEVRFPTANITKVAIGGPAGATGYATSARKGLDAAALAAQPEAGDLFAFAAPYPAAPATLAVLP
jgi:xylono-1,5-lactonase